MGVPHDAMGQLARELGAYGVERTTGPRRPVYRPLFPTAARADRYYRDAVCGFKDLAAQCTPDQARREVEQNADGQLQRANFDGPHLSRGEIPSRSAFGYRSLEGHPRFRRLYSNAKLGLSADYVRWLAERILLKESHNPLNLKAQLNSEARYDAFDLIMSGCPGRDEVAEWKDPVNAPFAPAGRSEDTRSTQSDQIDDRPRMPYPVELSEDDQNDEPSSSKREWHNAHHRPTNRS